MLVRKILAAMLFSIAGAATLNSELFLIFFLAFSVYLNIPAVNLFLGLFLLKIFTMLYSIHRHWFSCILVLGLEVQGQRGVFR